MSQAKLKTTTLSLPASADDLRKLEIGTVVYLDGRVFTAREGVYKRAVEDGVPLPVPPAELGTANFHCSPAASIEDDGTLNVGAVTATASFRFAKWLDWLVQDLGMQRHHRQGRACPARSTSRCSSRTTRST